MLQVEKSQSVSHPRRPFESVSTAELYATTVAFLRRQYPIILIIMFCTLALGAVYLLITPPLYTGTALLVIDSHKEQIFQEQSPTGVNLPIDSATVDSQVEILKAENIALSVIKTLNLTNDPEFVGSNGGLISALIGKVGNLFAHEEPPSQYQLTKMALERFESHLSVKRVNLTYVIEIDFESLSPDRSAQIANAIADAYVVDALDARYQSSLRTATWLQARLKELRAQASSADSAVVNFKSQNNIVDTGGSLLNEQQLAELNSALVLARAQTAEAQAKMERVNQILHAENSGTNIQDTATVTDSLHDEVITRLRSQYLDIAARESDWSARYGEDHAAVVNLRNQMAEIRHSIDDELHRIAETYKSDYEIAKSREDSLQQSLNGIVNDSASTNQAQIKLRDLEATSQSYRAMADDFLQAYMQSVQQQSFPITDSRLITRASTPLTKSHPKTRVVIAVSLAGGLMLGFATGLWREMADRVFRTPTQVEDFLHVPCIAMIPYVERQSHRTVKQVGRDRRRKRAHDGPLRQLIGHPFSQFSEELRSFKGAVDWLGANRANKIFGAMSMKGSSRPSSQANSAPASDDPEMGQIPDELLQQLITHPFSRFSEGLRSIKVAADPVGVSRSNKILGITSTFPKEGKTAIAASLGFLCAQAGSRVLVVDCDLRLSSLSRQLVPEATVGLMDAIIGNASLEEVIYCKGKNFSVLPNVRRTGVVQSSDLLAYEATKGLFEKLRAAFDYVIVDLPPLAPLVDVRVTTQFIDSYVYVVEWGRTKIDAIERALGAAFAIHENLLGVVLNKVDAAAQSRYDGYHGFYYQKRYYGEAD